MDRSTKKTSKFLSLVLRHHPDRIGLRLDADGWADIEALIRGATAAGVALDRDLLLRVVAENDKQRFALSEDGSRIRANQGHSVAVDLDLPEQAPPEVLFHGTVGRSLASIHQTGLNAGSRHHVHLSPDAGTATRVGQRRGQPVVLEIAAGNMARNGFRFFLSANGVWLTEHVPPEYIVFPAD